MDKTNKFFVWVIIAATTSLGVPLITVAQETPPTVLTAAPKKAAAKPGVKKARKIWTDDDVASLRSPAEIYTEEKEAQAAETARLAMLAAAAKQAPPAKVSKPVGGPPALANPKAVGDADKMIAWEDRDIEAQQEFIDHLRKELEQAPADQRERLQTFLQEHIANLEVTRKEREALVEKKKELEKQPPAAGNPAATPPPLK